MKQMAMALMTALTLTFCCLTPALAADYFVIDQAGYLDDTAAIEKTAREIYEGVGLSVCAYITDGVPADEMDAFMERIAPQGDALVLLVFPEEGYYMIHGSGAGEIIYEDSDFYTILCDAYSEPDTYQKGVQNFYDTAAYLWDVTDAMPNIYGPGEPDTADVPDRSGGQAPLPQGDGTFHPVERTLPLVVDFADVLTADDMTYLNDLAGGIAHEYPYEIAVAFVDTLNGADVMEYADDFYDYNGYGCGENDDGFLLLICPESRDYWMTTCGLGMEMFDEKRMKDIDDTVVSYLRCDDWSGAAAAFLRESEKCLQEGMPMPARPGIAHLIGSLLAGFGLGALPVSGMKKKMQSVQAQSRADNWVKDGGVTLTNSYDRFIVTHVSRRRIESSSGSSRSSGSHTSSSGRSHSGRGGKF